MPLYQYHCGNCNKRFTEQHSMHEHDGRRIQCPKCRSRKVNRVMEPFFARTSNKSV